MAQPDVVVNGKDRFTAWVLATWLYFDETASCSYLDLLHGVATPAVGWSIGVGVLVLAGIEVVIHLRVEFCRRLLGRTGVTAAAFLVCGLGSTGLVCGILLLIGSSRLGLRLGLTVTCCEQCERMALSHGDLRGAFS